jgi:hypothetical protein
MSPAIGKTTGYQSVLKKLPNDLTAACLRSSAKCDDPYHILYLFFETHMLTNRDVRALPGALVILLIILLINPKLALWFVCILVFAVVFRFVLLYLVTRDYGQKPKPLPKMPPELSREEEVRALIKTLKERGFR